MTFNPLRAIATVSAAAMVAILFLLLPGDWRGLAVLPVFMWLAAWPHLGPHLGRHIDDFWDEESAVPPEPPDHDPFAELEVPPELQRLTGPVGPPPAADVDPVGYWGRQAWGRTGEPWQQRLGDTGPHLLPAPTDTPGPGVRPPSLAGPGGSTGDQLAELELEHDESASALEHCQPGQPCELCRSLPEDPDLEHLAQHQAETMRFALLLERTRSSFDLLRRMHL